MRRILSGMLLFICPILIAALNSPHESEARVIVDRIYRNVQKTVDEKMEAIPRDEWCQMFGKDVDIVPIYPSDICVLKGEDVKYIKPREYFGDVEVFVTEHSNVSFEYRITDISPYYIADIEKSLDWATVTVHKEWKVDSKSFTISDFLTVNLKNMYISQIRNEFVMLQDTPEETLEGMLGKAAALYHSSKYDETVALYRRILSKYPNSDDAWYHLGVMYFMKQGVGKLTQKQRLQKAYDCWKHSNLKKARRAISYITDGRE